jgi:hypothetical protein
MRYTFQLEKRSAKGGRMNRIQLREALFRMEPIRNIVGFGDRLAFHIIVNKGDVLGALGPVEVPAEGMTGNDPDFESSAGVSDGRRTWLRRLLSALRA